MSRPQRFQFATSQPLTLTEDHVVSVLFVRGARSSIFGEGLFSDPAWDILLELYAAGLGGRTMTLSELARAIAAPISVTARWISALRERGLIDSAMGTSEQDPVPLSLSNEGGSRMEQLASNWASAFVTI